MSGDLVSLARYHLDEDERIARAASPSPWVEGGYGDFGWTARSEAYLDPTVLDARDLLSIEVSDSERGKADLAHIIRHQPARALRAVAARRRIVDAYAEALRIQDGYKEIGREEGRREALEMAVRAIVDEYEPDEAPCE